MFMYKERKSDQKERKRCINVPIVSGRLLGGGEGGDFGDGVGVINKSYPDLNLVNCDHDAVAR